MVQELDIELVNNQQQRQPCVLVLDASYSMQGTRIEQLNAGLKTFEQNIKDDDIAAERVQTMIIRCGGDVEVVSDWTDAENFDPPHLIAEGGTPLGEAVKRARDEIEKRKTDYRNAGVVYLRPWIFIISDGMPTDDNWENEADELKRDENNNKYTTFTVAVDDGDVDILSKFSNRSVVHMKGIDFSKMFVWLSKSMKMASRKVDDSETTNLPPVDWSSV